MARVQNYTGPLKNEPQKVNDPNHLTGPLSPDSICASPSWYASLKGIPTDSIVVHDIIVTSHMNAPLTTEQRIAYLEGSLQAAHAALAALQTQFYALLAAKPWTPWGPTPAQPTTWPITSCYGPVGRVEVTTSLHPFQGAPEVR